jgi:hypothetical protein
MAYLVLAYPEIRDEDFKHFYFFHPYLIMFILHQNKPYGIDVSSGVEKEKGIKDNNLIQEFLSLLKK